MTVIMKPKEILARIRNLRPWVRGDIRAPHKPLLLLLALARIAQGMPRLAGFGEIDKPLRLLLENYGPPRRTVHPEYPFWWLQTDGLWEVENANSLRRRSIHKEPLRSDLLRLQVRGGLPQEIYDTISGDRRLLDSAANELLHAHFPDSLHEPILNEIGLSVISDRRRDVAFREAVIQAYERRCAVCGYDVRMARTEIGIEAAHIKWWQARGPDEVQNGLALCSTHHRAFDLGAIGLTDDLTILVSGEVNGQSWARELFHEFNGRRIREPHSKPLFPRDIYLKWHRSQVFRGPARDL